MKKIFTVIFALIISFALVTPTQAKNINKTIEIQTKDARIIKAQLTYIEIPKWPKYSTVLLLHSLGYSSQYWGNLIKDLNNAGYAVIAMDLRGHGKSVYSTTFHKKSWVYFTNKNYEKLPSDALQMLEQVKKQDKRVNLNNIAIVGADIGANTAILAAKDMKVKPKTMVLISPTRKFKGLYTPIAMTELNFPILSMASTLDSYCVKEQSELAKFAQGGFYAQNYPQGGMGMMMIKSNPSMAQDITRWIVKYLK